MKRQLLFFIPVAVLSPLVTFVFTNLQDSSMKEIMLLIAFQYATYFTFTLFFFIAKKVASPQRFKQLVVFTIIPCIISIVWALLDEFVRQGGGMGLFIAALCSALSWYTKDLKGISIINKK